jgi:tetratricopeptide (TPR) repeat protein
MSGRPLALLWSVAFGPALVALSAEPATPPVAPAAYDSLVSENLDLREENARLTRDVERLRRENDGLAFQVRDLERRQEDLAATVRQLRVPEDTTRQLDELRADRASLVAEVARLYLQVSDLRQGSTGAPPRAATSPQPGSDLLRQLEKEAQELRLEVGRLRQQVQSGASAQSQADRRGQDLVQALEAERRTSAVLRAEVKARWAAAERDKRGLRKLAERVFECESENRRLQEQLTALRKLPAAGRAPAATEPVAAPDVTAEARRLVEARQYSEAERLYLANLKGGPDDARIHYNLGVLYEDYLKNPAKAAQHYRKYLELNPKAPDRELVRQWLVELDLQAR